MFDWGAVAVVLVLAGGAVQTIRKGFSATDVLDARFADRQLRARAGLDANHMIPRLARLLVDVTERLPAWALTQTTPEELAILMQDELQSADYIESLRALGSLTRDHDDLEGHFGSAEAWGLVKGIAGAVLLASLVYPALWVTVATWDLPLVWLWISVAAGSTALVTIIVSWIVETIRRTALVRLCRRYEAG